MKFKTFFLVSLSFCLLILNGKGALSHGLLQNGTGSEERNIYVNSSIDYLDTVEIISGVTGGKAIIGDTVTVNAIELGDYKFAYWQSPDGNILSTDNLYSFTMGDADITIEAIFYEELGFNIDWFTNPQEGANGNTEDTPYIINSAQDLAGVAALTNCTTGELEEPVDFFGKHIKLNNDIDLSEYSWTPISIYDEFRGSFDGNNKTISDIKFIILKDLHCVGLFGELSGTVKNLNITMTSNLNSPNAIGGIAAFLLEGEISNCSSTINVIAEESFIGGIVGNNSGGSIKNCTSTAKIDIGEESNVGGIIGINSGSSSILNCISSVDITAKSNSSVGGIAGNSNGGDINNCTSTSKINAEEESNIGGIIGVSGGNNFILKCTSSVDITVETYSNAGGIVGLSNNDNIEETTSTGEIFGTSNCRLGGISGTSNNVMYKGLASSCNLAGLNSCIIGGIASVLEDAEINSCLNTGNLAMGANSTTGGVSAIIINTTVVNCFNAGTLLSQSEEMQHIGGIIGVTEEDSLLLYSYFAQGNELNKDLAPCGFTLLGEVMECQVVEPSIFSTGEAAWMLNRVFENSKLIEGKCNSIWAQGDNYPVLADGDAIHRVHISNGDMDFYQFAKENELITLSLEDFALMNISSDDVEIFNGSFTMPKHDVFITATIYKPMVYDETSNTFTVILPNSQEAVELIVASFNDDIIVDTLINTVDITEFIPVIIDIKTLDILNADRIEIFTWENFDTIRPIQKSFEISLSEVVDN